MTASAHDGIVEVRWSPAARADSYRVQLVDLDSGAPLSDALVVRDTQAKLRGSFSQSAGVWVDARPGLRAVGLVTAGPAGGTGGPWQVFGPRDYNSGVLRASFPQLPAGEKLGVLLLNAGGRDDARAQVEISGVNPPEGPNALSRAMALVAEGPPAHPPALHAPPVTTVDDVAAAVEPAPVDEHRDFCVVPGLDFSRHIRKPATRVALTEHGAFYVDDEDLSEYEAPAVDALAQTFEQRVWPADTDAFGPPTDVDANGRVLVLMSHELGAHLNGGWLIGYFGNSDLLHARDDSPDCSSNGSNHAEIIYLNDLRDGVANGWAAKDLIDTVFPATLAHEFQHLLNLAHRCVDRPCAGPEETWINEGLSKIAEDLAGYGWNGTLGRGEGVAYMSRTAGAVRGYDGRSLTKWEGDPIGNYQGVHSFMRFFTDRMGTRVASAIAADSGGRQALEEVLGRPLPRAMAEWATALLVSNEPGAEYSFTGAAWSPLHRRLRHLDVSPPGAVSLRTDGIAAVVSGSGQDGSALVTVQSSEDVPPHVVVVRLAGTP